MISIWNSNARKVKCHCVDDEQKTFNNNNVGRFFFCFIQRKNHYKPLTIMIGNLVKNKPGKKNMAIIYSIIHSDSNTQKIQIFSS